MIIEKINPPKKTPIIITERPSTVLGEISPYPTPEREITAHQTD